MDAAKGLPFAGQHGLNRLVWAEFGNDIEACIRHEKRVKRWRREWKLALIEPGNPNWSDLAGQII